MRRAELQPSREDQVRSTKVMQQTKMPIQIYGFFSLLARATGESQSPKVQNKLYQVLKIVQVTTQQAAEFQLATQFKRRTQAPNDPKTSPREKVTLGSSFKQTRTNAEDNNGISDANRVIRRDSSNHAHFDTDFLLFNKCQKQGNTTESHTVFFQRRESFGFLLLSHFIFFDTEVKLTS